MRCVEVSGRLVVLDLSAGVYDVVDEVGTAMWGLLTQPPAARDLPRLAADFGASPSLVEADFSDFATAQLTAGRLVAEHQAMSAQPAPKAVRRRPSLLRALRERASATRDLQRDFATAYQDRVDAMADTREPRVDPHRLVKRFRSAESLYQSQEAPLDCLPRSLALLRYLRIAGWPARHVIGVALYPFEAHAWVELDGDPVNESAAYLRRFTVIQQA
ncbi:lasso peptide biosynthesis B2 protein [Gordonia crocea]|nr:lasso peptide biosynthesis B2 protein [Gordonia crocea]